MRNEKVYTYLGFAARARALASGYNTCLSMLKKRRIRLLLLAEDLAEPSKQKMTEAAERQGVPWRAFGSMDSLSHAAGVQQRGIYGVLNAQLAETMMREIDHMQPERREVL